MRLINTHQTGFFHDENADPEQYIFGASPIQADILQADRNWQQWCPEPELQNANGFDPLSCASYNTLNPLEILIRRKFGFTEQFSDRYLAYITDTQRKMGNDPHYVAERLRKDGDVDEHSWPFLENVTTFEEYYRPPPLQLSVQARDFLDKWSFKHDTVRGLDAMWDALQYSPLGCSVGWNAIDDNGYWYKNGSGNDFHWTTIVGGEYGKYFLAFDSAEPVWKKIRWQDFKPQLVKRYSIELAPPTVTFLEKAKQKLLEFLQWLAKQPPTAPIVPQEPPKPAPPNNLLNTLALAFQKKEGGKPQDLNMRLHNPGACRYSSVGYLPKYGVVKEHLRGNEKPGQRGFAHFATYELGFLYLKNLILEKAKKHPDWNLFDLANNWAPKNDGNDPVKYGEDLGTFTGLNPSTFRLRSLLS